MDSMNNAMNNKANSAKFPTLEMRDAFLVFNADTLGDYAQYINPTDDDACGESNNYRTFEEQFRLDDYVHGTVQESKKRQFLYYIANSQMFSYLLQQRHTGECYVSCMIFLCVAGA